MPSRSGVIPPGSSIGILGGGQLGRMTALAAANLGYRCHVYCPDADEPALQVSADATVAPYDDEGALDIFAGSVDVVTFEFENVPYASVQRIARQAAVRPGWNALATSQDRRVEKAFLAGIGIPLGPYRPVDRREDLEPAVAAVGLPAILKSARLGYDGKGQVRIRPGDDLDAAWDAIGYPGAVLEAIVPFEREISAVVARGLDGELRAWDPVENRHRDHVLAETIAPAPVSPLVADAAVRAAEAVASALDLVGILAVEFFLLPDGRLLANEIAPRPHNSGHWTIDACRTSQFEQHVRAVCGLPLGPTERHSDARMQNLLGDDVVLWAEAVRDPRAKLHLYGKAEARPGRKMGHITRLYPPGTSRGD